MQLTSTNVRSGESPSTLTGVLASQEGVNTAMSLQGGDALALADILDQVGGSSAMIREFRLILQTGFRGSEHGP